MTPSREELLARADEYLFTVRNRGDCGPHHLVSDLAFALRSIPVAAKPADDGVREATIERVSKRLAQMADNMGGMHAPELERLSRALSTKAKP